MPHYPQTVTDEHGFTYTREPFEDRGNVLTSYVWKDGGGGFIRLVYEIDGRTSAHAMIPAGTFVVPPRARTILAAAQEIVDIICDLLIAKFLSQQQEKPPSVH